MNPIDLMTDIRICEDHDIDFLHLDIMDGKFVPRLGLYPEIVSHINRHCGIPCDLHLMVNDIDFILDQFLPCESIKLVSFHIENNSDKIYYLIDRIKNFDVKVGIVVNLSSDINFVIQLLNDYSFDSLMFMGITIG